VLFTEEEIAQGKVNYNYTMQESPSAEAPVLSVFYKDAANGVFDTYSTQTRPSSYSRARKSPFNTNLPSEKQQTLESSAGRYTSP
jgi:predicted dithiol-disulfide oxidoreductase (DUF899 family)